ncbi:MAG: hypothetical protein IKJ19_00130 [Clostridia bacterium]|nr:hypothetical protein [Clostridia bacterium]
MEGKWICYPGDYEIMLAEKVHARRYQRDFPIAPFWRVDSPWHHVRFFKVFKIDKPTRLHFSWEGRISVFFRRPVLHLDDVYSYEFNGIIDLPAGEHYMDIWVYNPNGLPCLKIDSDSIVTDGSFEVAYNQIDLVPAYEVNCGNLTPNTFALPTREIKWVKEFELNGDKIYDFGKLIFAYASVKGSGKYRLYFGETLNEATNNTSQVKLLAEKAYFGLNEEQTRETFCEQIEFFDINDHLYHKSKTTKAFRYLRVVGGAHELKIEEEYDDKPIVVEYKCENKRLQKIFETALYTFSLCTREFYLDGIKRDRWLWGGDAYEAEKAEYYYQHDTDRIKQNIIALFGKSPVVRYINHILDYTLYTLISVWEYYEHTGDKKFLSFIEPIFSEHLNFCLGRVSKDGFICSIPRNGEHVDWIFVDWGQLPDKKGEVSFEQILFWKAITCSAKIYEILGKDNTKLLEKAEELKTKTNEIFFDKQKGVFVFARNNGVLDTTVTCHANIFAILYGFASEEQKNSILSAIQKGEMQLSITPFMIEFVLASLFEGGQWQNGAKMLEDFWGGMVDTGTSTFWETYQEGEQEESATAMYGRPFGRSHCHIWGAGPLYLIPRYYYGLRDDLEFGKKFVLEPNLNLIKNSYIKLPLAKGTITVECSSTNLLIFANEVDGELVLNGKHYTVKKGEKLNVEI